jgi:hypothetical protein
VRIVGADSRSRFDAGSLSRAALMWLTRWASQLVVVLMSECFVVPRRRARSKARRGAGLAQTSQAAGPGRLGRMHGLSGTLADLRRSFLALQFLAG